MAAKPTNTIAHISRVIAFHRKASGLSREALADLAGIGKTALFDIEHGKTTVRFETLRRVLDALNITIRLESPLMPRFEEQTDAEG
jgi:HTH-type transcriptional regulator/antitoxin HipB